MGLRKPYRRYHEKTRENVIGFRACSFIYEQARFFLTNILVRGVMFVTSAIDLKRSKYDFVAPKGNQFWLFLLLGFLGAIGMIALSASYSFASASVVAAGYTLSIPIAALTTLIVKKEKLTLRQWVGILVSIIGISLIAFEKQLNLF